MTQASPNPSTTLYLMQQRRRLSSLCLAACVALALTATLHLNLTTPYIVPLLSAATFLLHVALDPLRRGFWHHRRIRPLGVTAMLGLTALVTLGPPTPIIGPLLFALAIAFRHQRGGHLLHCEVAQEMEELRRKILALESRHGTGSLLAYCHPTDDKLRKAS